MLHVPSTVRLAAMASIAMNVTLVMSYLTAITLELATHHASIALVLPTLSAHTV